MEESPAITKADSYRLIGLSSANQQVKIVTVRSVDEQEKSKLDVAAKNVRDFGTSQSLYLMYRKNHDEILSFWKKTQTEYRRSQRCDDALAYDICVDITRHLMNLLTTYRAFVDHWKTKLKRRSRKTGDTKYFDKLEALIADCKKVSFPFAFFWEFRNYVQHVGLPAFGLHFSSNLTSGSEPGVFHRSEIYLSRDALLQSYDWDKAEGLLRKQRNELDVIACLESVIPSMEQLAIICIESGLEVVQPSLALLTGVISEVEQKIPGATPAIVYYEPGSSPSLKAQITHFPLHLMNLLRPPWK